VDPRVRLGEGRAGRRRQAGRPDRLADAEPGPDGEADTVVEPDADHHADGRPDIGGDADVDAHSDPVVLAVAEPDRHDATDPPADRVSDAGADANPDADFLSVGPDAGTDTDSHSDLGDVVVADAESVAHAVSVGRLTSSQFGRFDRMAARPFVALSRARPHSTTRPAAVSAGTRTSPIPDAVSSTTAT
jgi:hypothetical protein